MKSICFIFLLLVICNMTGGVIKEYILGNVLANWYDAQSYCRLYYRDLVTINSEEENEQCFQAAEPISFGGWIGLSKISGSWTWSDGQPLQKWYDNSNSYIDYPTFGDSCVHMSNGGYWLSDHCGYGKNFYCYRFLILVKENKTWDEAQNWCKATYTGLASVPSQSNLWQMKVEAAKTQTVNVWTGLRFTNGNWSWVSGEPLGSLILANRSCPVLSNSCGALQTTSNSIINQNCTHKQNFVCYMK